MVAGVCLNADYVVRKVNGIPRLLSSEVMATLWDPRTQWMVYVSATVYLLMFVIVRRAFSDRGVRRTGRGKDVGDEAWLIGLAGLAGLEYLAGYDEATKATSALTLLGSATVGNAIAALVARGGKALYLKYSDHTLVTLIMLLTLGAAWQPDLGFLFRYRTVDRWCGVWQNPNTFGLLMASGLALAVGEVEGVVQSPGSAADGLAAMAWDCVKRTLLLGAGAAMGVGLVKSYSRGAWVGAAAGLGYMAWQVGKAETLKSEMLKGERAGRTRRGLTWSWAAQQRVTLGVIAAAVIVLALWGLAHRQGVVARRAFSVANANDFSWRNRVAACEGALQMLADRPWFGFGWNQPERVYSALYCPAKVQESMAIELNDYLMLGTTLGVPTLVCFLMYVWLSLTGRSPIPNGQSQIAEGEWMKAVCRAGAVVLLVGFWFDGGLFKLATGATFWILLELGREEATSMDDREWRMQSVRAGGVIRRWK